MGSLLYNAGGFTLPFFTFGFLNICLSLALIKLMPEVSPKQRSENQGVKKLTFSAMAKVRRAKKFGQ